ncbi:tetratricopeptide (TPR) repeat protein [Rhizobium sp. SG_E_25_P2]|jgi:tetratricopeptide (TPR) repeat protein|uniref:tetratricopeptide repeat protein n=1 Tax=Rhizobium sp. SG_E_25_P2 TaxID=2879942 RepID=UPI002473B619|nr:tetratricopeptide repeat protein [Rhizobium sp. SG_E_25_P2]MDH6269493.1 tetratricopeptide (TPR) repeat protein [Rhizobium sp. SG_E_25_P2]
MPAMRFFVFALSLAVTSPLLAEEAKPGSPPPERIVEQKIPPLTPPDHELDLLFAQLKKERNPQAARLIADRITSSLFYSGSATVDMLMGNARKATEEKRFGAALDFLDQITLLAPGYAEGWNARASLHYQMGNFPKAMADTAHVLKLEPRHLGALSGLAAVLSQSGRDQQALAALEAYLDRYPADRDAQKRAIDLMIKLDGQRT